MAKPKPTSKELTKIVADRARYQARDAARLSHSPVPEWKSPPVDIPVADLRQFLSKYGPRVSVLVTWSHENQYQFVTIGSDRLYSDAAVNLRNEITAALKLDPLGPTKEDLRGDHPNVVLDLKQLDFLLWLLGRAHGESDKLSSGHRKYIKKYHDALMKAFGDAKDKLVNAPT